MSEDNQVWVSVGITKNIGNYESLRIDAGARLDVYPHEDRDAVWSKLWSEVEAQIEERLQEAGLDKKGKK